MKPLRLAVVGDLHFAGLANLFTDWLTPTTFMLDQIIQYCLDKGIKHIFFSGDIFNVSEPPQAVLLAFCRYFSQFEDQLKFIFYAGNHDIKDIHVNSLHLLAGITEFAMTHCTFITTPEVVHIKNHDIVVLPWPHTKLPPKSHNAKLGFAHVIVSGTEADNGRKFSHGEKLSRKLFWIIGDLHKYQKSKFWNYPGALFQGNFQDDTKRYFLDVFIDEEVSVNRQLLQTPYRLLTKIIKEPRDFDFLKASNTYWRIYADYDIAIPQASNILLRLPRTKAAKAISKDINQGLDEVTISDTIPTAASYLKAQGYMKADRMRLLRKLKELR